jgi:hypothetical protein
LRNNKEEEADRTSDKSNSHDISTQADTREAARTFSLLERRELGVHRHYSARMSDGRGSGSEGKKRQKRMVKRVGFESNAMALKD